MKNIKDKKYTLNSIETYHQVMSLRKETGWGPKKIKEHLIEKRINPSIDAIKGWIYSGKKPFITNIITQIPDTSRELSKEKAYVLGTLCGDGWLSTGYRIGLKVIDCDFAKYFKGCFFRVYGVRGSLVY